MCLPVKGTDIEIDKGTGVRLVAAISCPASLSVPEKGLHVHPSNRFLLPKTNVPFTPMLAPPAFNSTPEYVPAATEANLIAGPGQSWIVEVRSSWLHPSGK